MRMLVADDEPLADVAVRGAGEAHVERLLSERQGSRVAASVFRHVAFHCRG